MSLINPSLVAAASPGVTGPAGPSARKPNAESYAAAMREAAGKAPASTARAEAAPAETARSTSREAPFGVDRPRYQRPGALLDIRV